MIRGRAVQCRHLLHPGEITPPTVGLVDPGRPGRLLVFGVDEYRNVYWYYPAWTDPAANPVAVTISDQPGQYELGEAISHKLKGRSLTIYGIFIEEAISVRRVEDMVSGMPALDKPLPLPASTQKMLQLTVKHPGKRIPARSRDKE